MSLPERRIREARLNFRVHEELAQKARKMVGPSNRYSSLTAMFEVLIEREYKDWCAELGEVEAEQIP